MVKRTSTPIEQTARLLDLVPFLLSHQGIPVEQLAEHFRVTKEIILDDLNTLWMCGLPGYTPLELIDLEFDSGFVTIRNADPLAEIRALVGSELVALVLGLDLLATGSSDLSNEIRARIEDLSERIRSKIGSGISVADPGQSEIRALIQKAIVQRASVRIQYFSPQKDEVKERTITPFDFFHEGAFEYVRAFCDSSNGVRTFRMDRIKEISKNFILHTSTQSSSTHKEPLVSTVRIIRGDRSTAESLALASEEVVVGGVLSLSAYSVDWLTRTVLASRGDLVVEGPSQARNSILQSLDSTLALYEEGAIALAPKNRT
jgi:proteasome accessory factor C